MEAVLIAGFVRQQHFTINKASTHAAALLLDCGTLPPASKYFSVWFEEWAWCVKIVGPVIAATMKLVKWSCYKKHHATWCASPAEHTPSTHHASEDCCTGHECMEHPVLAEQTMVETTHCQCCPISGGWSSTIRCRARGAGLRGLHRHSNLLHPLYI